MTNLLHPHTRSCWEVLLFWAGWHRGPCPWLKDKQTLSSQQQPESPPALMGAVFLRIQLQAAELWQNCTWGAVPLPWPFPREHRYHCRELGQPSPLLCLWVLQLYPDMYLMGTCFFTGCTTVCAHLCPKMLQPGVQTSPQWLLFASKAWGEVAMSTEAASHAHPPQCSPRRHITCQGERLCVGSIWVLREISSFPEATLRLEMDADTSILNQPYSHNHPLFWLGINLQVFHNHFLLH